MMVITQALAELKTLESRIQAKTKNILAYAARPEIVPDPLAASGGSTQYVSREHQSVSDLHWRTVAIRTAINAANAANTLTVCGMKHTIAEWLIWRREVLARRKEYLNQLLGAVMQARSQKPQVMGAEGKPVTVNSIINIDEQAIRTELEQLINIEGTLDGELSLANATITITVNP